MSIGTKRRFELSTRRAPEVPINLLPQEVVGEQRTRRYFGYAVLGSITLVVLLVALSVVQHLAVNKQQRDLAASQAQVAALQTQIGGLAEFDKLKQSVDAK